MKLDRVSIVLLSLMAVTFVVWMVSLTLQLTRDDRFVPTPTCRVVESDTTTVNPQGFTVCIVRQT